MSFPFPDKITQLKKSAELYRSLSPDERFSDFVTLLTIVDQTSKRDLSLFSRQQAWMDKEKNKIQDSLRQLLKIQHDQTTT